MKVLQINCVYNVGSTGKIVYDLHKEFQNKAIESYVCYGRGEKVEASRVFKTANEVISKGNNLISRFTGIQYAGSYLGTKKLIQKIEEIRPDIVHLHCINGFFVNIYKILSYLKKNNISTVLTLHAEFMYTGNCGYALECEKWKDERGCHDCEQLKQATGSYFLDRTHTSWERMKNAFSDFKKLEVVSVSPWLEERAKQSVILRDKNHSCIFNGIDVDNVFCYRRENANKLRSKLGLVDKKIVLYVTAAFSKFKGADYILELSKKMSKVVFLVVGNREPIENCPENLLPIGRVENQKELADYYSMADITILTSKKETFSMVCAESLSCGTPVIGFKAGAPEGISMPQYSKFCEYGNLELLEKYLNEAFCNSSFFEKEEISKSARIIYSKGKMCNEYIKIYERLYDEK